MKIYKYFQIEDSKAFLLLQPWTLQGYRFIVLILLPEKKKYCTSGRKQSLTFISALHFHRYVPREESSGYRSQFSSNNPSFKLQIFLLYFENAKVWQYVAFYFKGYLVQTIDEYLNNFVGFFPCTLPKSITLRNIYWSRCKSQNDWYLSLTELKLENLITHQAVE